MSYHAPIQDMISTLKSLGFEGTDDAEAIFEEAGKLATDVLAPLNWTGDRAGVHVENGEISMPEGFKDAYNQYRDGGWNAVPFPEEWGGMELPYGIAFPVQEMWQAANMSFGLCPLLNQGAVEALIAHGSDELQALYLEKLVSGEWTGTMNLTEPQAGSDLSLLKAKAIPQEDGSYKVSGQKIYITYGEHDLAENIIHLVLARLPDAPEGTKGISLFLVPKFLPDGERNDLVCVSTEHKLGIHASPTCTMSFGDEGGAIGWLIGEENKGLACMFTMMNNARLSVGLQGVAISDRALQAAKHYASERKQGKDPATGETIAIEAHPEVQRQLLTMESLTHAGRAITYRAALEMDKAHHGKAAAQAIVALLTPIVKGFCTENSVEIASLGVQVHGGMGFIEETGAAQHYRDARILPIYEGTNGIQALDLVGYKLRKDQGATAHALIDEIKETASAPELINAIKNLEETTQHVLSLLGEQNISALGFGAHDFMMQWGYVLGGALLEKLSETDSEKASITAFYLHHILPRATAHKLSVLAAK